MTKLGQTLVGFCGPRVKIARTMLRGYFSEDCLSMFGAPIQRPGRRRVICWRCFGCFDQRCGTLQKCCCSARPRRSHSAHLPPMCRPCATHASMDDPPALYPVDRLQPTFDRRPHFPRRFTMFCFTLPDAGQNWPEIGSSRLELGNTCPQFAQTSPHLNHNSPESDQTRPFRAKLCNLGQS